MSSLKRGNSEDFPPTPPPRNILNRPSISGADSDNADEDILVGTHEIQAQIDALKRGGLLPQRSFSQVDEQPLSLSLRRRPLRGTMSGGEWYSFLLLITVSYCKHFIVFCSLL